MGLWLIPLTSLHFSVKQLYQFGAQMRLWFISLTISTLSHPTVLWSWCPHPTVWSVWWPNETVTYFTHFLYTLISNCLVLKWYYNSYHSPPLNVNVTKSQHLFHSKIYAPSSSLLQGKHLPFSSSPLRLNIFRLFVILSRTQLYRYTPEIFLFSTATFKYTYRAPLRQIGQE
jgi:hypothetical protein